MPLTFSQQLCFLPTARAAFSGWLTYPGGLTTPKLKPTSPLGYSTPPDCFSLLQVTRKHILLYASLPTAKVGLVASLLPLSGTDVPVAGTMAKSMQKRLLHLKHMQTTRTMAKMK